jgi:hypothetical protein
MSYGDADKMQQGLCSSQSSLDSNQGFWVDVSRTVDPNGAAAFSDCVKALRGGLDIQARINDDETMAAISIAYLAPYGAGPGTLNGISYPGWDCPAPPAGADMRSIVSKQGQLTNSQVTLVCSRKVSAAPFVKGGLQLVADDAQLTIATSVGNYTQFFRPKIYQDPLADTAKVMASYPKGTILPFAGHIENIPAGWHICDGHDGTVNLVDYIPYGASTNAQIDLAAQDKHEGNRTHTHTVPDTQYPYRGFNYHVVQGGKNVPMTAMGTDTQAHIAPTGPADNLPAVTRVFFMEKIL